MSEGVEPVVMERVEFCTSKCNRNTRHRMTIYSDVEYHRCLECGHTKTFHFPQQEGDEPSENKFPRAK